MVNKIYEGHPVGSFRTVGACLSGKNDYLAVFGDCNQPQIFRFKTKQVFVPAKDDPFDVIMESDGFDMAHALNNIKKSMVLVNNQTTVLDA